jgi:probable HAF family extracellular repeat protein
MWTTATILLAAVTLSAEMAAQHSRYKLIDLGTFGGPASYLTDPGEGPGFLALNNQGVLVGYADTATSADAYRWKNGSLIDLGTLPGGDFSAATSVNARGWIAVFSTTGEFDPLVGGPQGRGAIWRNGQLTPLATLGGLEGNAAYVNDVGQVVGFSTIGTDLDPSGFSFLGSPIHPFIWQNGVIRDLGTLGGPDALPTSNCNNQRSDLVTGFSLIDSVPNPLTGVPTMHPFLWQDGKMIDLGTLGGTLVSGFLSNVQCANNRGQVAGATTLAGDSIVHAFF